MRFFCFLFLGLLLVGCGSSRSQLQQESSARQVTSKLDSSFERKEQFTLDSLLARIDANIQVTESTYSLPDSSGKQYLLSTMVKNIQLKADSQRQTAISIKQGKTITQDSFSTLQGNATKSEKQESEKRVFHPPNVYYLILILVVFFIVRKIRCS